MGQQQLLIIILGVITVAIAVAVGINLFSESAELSNRDAVIDDLNYIAASLLAGYKTPVLTGGLQGDYTNLYTEEPVKKLKKKRKKNPTTGDKYYWETNNGTYEFTVVTKDSVRIKGLGTETGRDNLKPVRVEAYVGQGSFSIEIKN